MTGEFSDDALAERFADRFCDDFLYIDDRGWFCREADQDGNPAWAPGRKLSIIRAIRGFLRGLAEERPRGCGMRMRLGALATINAVEELARSDFAGVEADLEPGALARQEVEVRELLKEMRKQTGRQQAPQIPLAVPAPRKPVFAPLPTIDEVKGQIATAADAFSVANIAR